MNKIIIIGIIAVSIGIRIIYITSVTQSAMFADGFEPVKADLIKNATIPTSIAKSNNGFAIDFYKQISNDTDNHFFSSLSMYTAFSILYEGARGNTADELAETFGFETDDTIRHNDTAHMISSINRNDRHATLTMANALWIAKWFSLYDSYSGIAHDTYKSTAKTVDFTDPKDSVDRINKWAADNTNNKITEVITPNDVDDLTAMVINNAIYFKGTWLTQFLPENTKESDFWISETNNVTTNFMNMKDYFNYTKSDGAQVLKMPYKGDRLSMLVILPDERHGIKQLEENLSAEQIEKWKQELHSTDVSISMPKFKMNTNYDLIPPLKDLGISDVFNRELSNLTGIADTGDNRLFVTGANQAAFVDVNEEGTEAAAVTTIIAEIVSVPPPPEYFIADHPFIFIIQDDESGTILFMGRMYYPAP